VAAVGSDSSSARSCSRCSWAVFRHSSSVARRRNEAAPALVRTRMPSWATRSMVTRPWCIKTQTLVHQDGDAFGEQLVQKLGVSGASEQVVRTVTENSRTLKFTSHGFESE